MTFVIANSCYLKALKVLLSFRMSSSVPSLLSLFHKVGDADIILLLLLFDVRLQSPISTTTSERTQQSHGAPVYRARYI